MRARRVRAADVIAGAAHDDARQLEDQARLFGQRNELDRGNQRSVRLAPAREHLGAPNTAVPGIYRWLIIWNDLAVAQCAPQVVDRVVAPAT